MADRVPLLIDPSGEPFAWVDLTGDVEVVVTRDPAGVVHRMPLRLAVTLGVSVIAYAQASRDVAAKAAAPGIVVPTRDN